MEVAWPSPSAKGRGEKCLRTEPNCASLIFFFFINFFIKALQGSSDLTKVFVITDYLL